jgi:hypothetical protein
MDPQDDRIVPIENDRFKDSNGMCKQLIEQLRKGFTTMKVTRHGVDRTTSYVIEGVQ